ncbi:UNVERIFIED_CONTAM: hypothetical protein H355_011968 [Colinus virginianus]|nr:hypothetical protein H355_011968 [Colinus virginianus]
MQAAVRLGGVTHFLVITGYCENTVLMVRKNKVERQRTATKCLQKIIQQLVNGIIAPTTIPNLGLGPW